jgi:hypothetical protein
MAIVALQAPDFRTIAEFRRRHLAALSALLRAGAQAVRAALVKLGHVALEGECVHAQGDEEGGRVASRMPPKTRRFGADRRGDEMPDWVADKQARQAKLREAKAELEAKAKAKAKAKAAAEQAARGNNDDKPRRKLRPRGSEPKAQRNFTDSESRSSGPKMVTSRATTRRPQSTRRHRSSWRKRSATTATIRRSSSPARRHQGQPGERSARSIGPCRARLSRRMSARLRHASYRSRYRLRKQVVEPVFGEIKQARGFRQFLFRGSRR